MGTDGKALAHDRHSGLAHTLHRCPKPCQTSSYYDDIVLSDHGEPIKYKVILYSSNPPSPPFTKGGWGDLRTYLSQNLFSSCEIKLPVFPWEYNSLPPVP